MLGAVHHTHADSSIGHVRCLAIIALDGAGSGIAVVWRGGRCVNLPQAEHMEIKENGNHQNGCKHYATDGEHDGLAVAYICLACLPFINLLRHR